MGKRCINFSDGEEIVLKKEAAKNGITVSALIRKMLFQEMSIDDFINFQNEQEEINRQLIELLKAIHTQSRIGTNITAKMYTTAFPDVARDEIKKVKDKFLGGENNA